MDTTDSYAEGTIDWFGTMRAKSGFTVEQFQFYATGGQAFAGASATITKVDTVTDFTDESTHVGWTIGAGTFYKLSDQISIGTEYLYAD